MASVKFLIHEMYAKKFASGFTLKSAKSFVNKISILLTASVWSRNILTLPFLKLVVVATGDEAGSTSQLVTVSARSVESGTPLQPEPVPDMARCHIFAAHTSAKG
jgi:hypothetical protein